MLPYLAAIGLISQADLSWPVTGLTLLGYCVLMCLPAVVLSFARLAGHAKVDPILERLNAWLTRNTAKLLGWTVGGIGIAVTFNALIVLLFDR